MLYICHMLTIVFFLLPALVCLVWSVVYLFAKKTDIQHAFGIILLIGVLYFLSYALYINPSAETIWVCRFDAINQPLCLFLLVKIIVYVLSYSDLRQLCNVINIFSYFMLMVHGTIVWMAYGLLGFENAAGFMDTVDAAMLSSQHYSMFTTLPEEYQAPIYWYYYMTTTTVFDTVAAVLAFLILLSAIYLYVDQQYKAGDVIRFLRGGRRVPKGQLVAFLLVILFVAMAPLIVFGRLYLMQHEYVGIVTSAVVAMCILLLAYIELHTTRQKVTLSDFLRRAKEVEPQHKKDEEAQKKEKLHRMMTEKVAPENVAVRTRILLAKLRESMEVMHVYTNPDLTINDLADILETNRTSLSNLINQQYGVNFRELINRYRLIAAKEYMLEHPSATQKEIALEVGFRDATAFSHKFKALEGMSPMAWLAGQL